MPHHPHIAQSELLPLPTSGQLYHADKRERARESFHCPNLLGKVYLK